ncbi:MAG: HAMP domain-containing histidine kinase [Burkholderiaceae bacterium]|nr:MAG: HAMP domain-containing histidine kinase [Burkholderiaceae bacterium]
MHATLSELLENLQPGMLWLSRDGLVRFANAQAVGKLRLNTGSRVQEPTLLNALNGTVLEQSPRMVTIGGQPAGPGEPAPELRCKVLPGLSRDDAMVLVTDSADEHAAVGFDNLMMVIRSDLRDPLRELNQALVLARNERDVHALDALCDQVDEVTHVLNKLIDLASVWGSESLMANDRIELWPLLQQAWAKVEPLARARNLKARFTAQGPKNQLATIYGSEHWLLRVFVECLEAAIRAARPGGMLDIEHRQMGPRALIVLRDSGAFVAARAESTPMETATSRSPGSVHGSRLASRDLIGLKLCQQVVAQHGGQLREEHDDGQRNFLIDLPTGAPFRPEATAADIAQAQVYARDLAALMARRRDARSNKTA